MILRASLRDQGGCVDQSDRVRPREKLIDNFTPSLSRGEYYRSCRSYLQHDCSPRAGDVR